MQTVFLGKSLIISVDVRGSVYILLIHVIYGCFDWILVFLLIQTNVNTNRFASCWTKWLTYSFSSYLTERMLNEHYGIGMEKTSLSKIT